MKQSMSREDAENMIASELQSQAQEPAAQVKAIGEKEIKEATDTLNKYKSGKANFDKRVVENEEWYRLRHWECMRRTKPMEVEPTSAWLFNCISNKHADMMDNYPEANILPREQQDEEEADRLKSIIPVIVEQCDFEDTYDACAMDFLKYGACVYGVFWNPRKDNGLGDIDIARINLLNIFTEPGVQDIQKSRNIFTVEFCDNDLLLERYPELRGKLSSPTVVPERYITDDSIDTTNKSTVIDWYYKKNVNGKDVLHYVKYVNDVVLFATENETEGKFDEAGNMISAPMAETGLYDDGNYPFVIVPFNETEGSPFGFGLIDIGKSSQEWIDRGNQALMKSMMANAKPRYFVREDCAINEKDFADTNVEIVKYTGASPNDSAIAIQANPVNAVYVNILQYKIEELKEVTGNRDVSTGGAESGVTAASAIAALQESASKGSRDINKKSYRGFREIVNLIIERIRQFYNIPRQFRIIGERGAMKFVQYSNEALKPQFQGVEYGVDGGYRLPVLDIEVTAQKASPYSKMSQNELALQLYQAGFFQPGNADNALACVEMMDFDDKDEVSERIAQNGTLFQMLQQAQMQIAALEQMLGIKRDKDGQIVSEPGQAQTNAKPEEMGALGGDEKKVGESPYTKKARARTAEATAPR